MDMPKAYPEAISRLHIPDNENSVEELLVR